MSDAWALVRAFSDHRVVVCTRYTKNIVTNPRYVKKRSYKNFDEDAFIQKVKDMNFMDIYMCEGKSQAAEILFKKLNYVLDKMIKKTQIRLKYA